MKATTHKAITWFRQVLDADPGDTEARWMLAALVMAQGSGFPIELLARLVPEHPEHPYILRWLVDGTMWTLEQSGADYSAALREELSTLKNVLAVRSLLEAPTGSDELGRSVRVARSVLAGSSIHVAVEGLNG